MNQEQVRYQDAMDPTRTLVPVKWNGKTVECKVYWKGTGYGGKTTLPASLFSEDLRNKRVGFFVAPPVTPDKPS